MEHKYQPDEIVIARASGKPYRIIAKRSDSHRKLKGEPGYDVVSLREGKSYGPIRLMRESSLTRQSCQTEEMTPLTTARENDNVQDCSHVST